MVGIAFDGLGGVSAAAIDIIVGLCDPPEIDKSLTIRKVAALLVTIRGIESKRPKK